MAKQGKKLTDELKEMIKAELVLSNNKNEIARKFGVSWSTVDKIEKEANEKDDGLEKLREIKKKELIERIWDNITDAVELGNQMVKEARKGRRDIPLSHISTYVGTLYDKQALMQGESTQNIGGGMVIQVGIPDNADEE